MDTGEMVSDYSASAAWKWQNTDTFILRGRARLQGENQVFSGPFVLLASRSAARLRGDFCGPDGSPLLSLSGDSTGFVFYYPDQGAAVFAPGGLPVNRGILPVNSVIALIRTGFPAVPVQWEMAETYLEGTSGCAEWSFTSGIDSMKVVLEQGELFPIIESGEVRLEVTATSWHDSFRAWPMEWLLSSPSLGVVAKIRSFDEVEAEDLHWELVLPVMPDTLVDPPDRWEYSLSPSIR